MKPHAVFLTILGLWAVAVAGDDAPDRETPTIYVPAKDIASLIAPGDRAVLMRREAFEKLLASAKAAGLDGTHPAAQITRADYQGQVAGETLTLTGSLRVVSLSDKPVAVALRFGRLGLRSIELDGKPAPLGYDRSGRLVLIVAGRGPHALKLSAGAELKELSGGGMQFSISVPPATAGEMRFAAPGDLEVHATVPVSSRRYDTQADRTDVALTIGGHEAVTVALMGNGRQEDQRAILLGTSATTVQLTRADETMHCLYTVQVLRRGVRELTFSAPAAWTITNVSCPSLVQWSVTAPGKPGEPKKLLVRLRTASRGTKALHIQATAARGGPTWNSPFVKLAGADFEHGHLLVDTAGELKVRGEVLHGARREDVSRAHAVPGLLAATRGRLFYHWADGWSVRLDLATVALRRSCEAHQRLDVTPEEIVLTGRFDVTAVGRELFDLAFDLPPAEWRLGEVSVGGKTTGFEYHVASAGAKRTLKIALARPVRSEGVMRVRVRLHHVPSGWSWPARAVPRDVALPIVRAVAETVSGQVAVAASGDLDVAAAPGKPLPKGFSAVTVGRMSALGLDRRVQLAYTYDEAGTGTVPVRVSRRAHRMSADAVGLITARPGQLLGLWRVTVNVSRAHARELYLLVDKSLGRQITITAPGRRFSAKTVVAPGPETVELLPEAAKVYDLWRLTLDSQAIGAVRVDVRYDRPLPAAGAPVPLVRPIGSDQITELLAIQASEELGLSVSATGTSDVDAVDLPALPAAASRLLRALRIDGPTTPAGAGATVQLATKVYDKYAIPPALAADASITTYLGARGAQRTEAIFRVANAGQQFLTVCLPAGAQLWSVRVGGTQAKPRQEAADRYLLAVPRSAKPVEVRVVFALPRVSASLGRIALGRARLDGVDVNTLRWTVVPPPGYRVRTQYSDMQAESVSRPKLAGEELLDGFIEVLGVSHALFSIGSARLSQRVADDVAYLPSAGAPEGGRERHRPDSRTRAPADAETTTVLKDESESMERKREGKAKPPKLPVPSDEAKKEAPDKDKAHKSLAAGVALFEYRRAGRYTLPVELVATPHAGPTAVFSSLGDAELEIGLSETTTMGTTDWLGLGVVLLAGLVLLRQSIARRVAFIAAMLGVSTLVAIWWSSAAYFANGAFLGALWLVPAYVVIGCAGWLWRKVFGAAPARMAAAATVAVLAGIMLLSASPARAGGKAAPAKGPVKPSAPRRVKPVPPRPAETPMVVPYEGDPTRLPGDGKVLVSYRRYVELWNRAHPAERIDLPAGPVDVSLSGVRYAATLDGERMTLRLTAGVRTFGNRWVSLPVPMKNLAVTAATLDGANARLHVAAKGMVLRLPGDTAGVLKMTAVTTPKKLGRRGSVTMSLPPLPGGVLTVLLPADDLVLEAPGVAAAPSRAPGPGGKGVLWTVALGMRRDVTLSWSPKVGAGAADRTLSASIAHDVYAFHWALVGVSKARYSFSAGENERFALLLPADATLTDLTGANVRDVRQAGTRTIDGATWKVVEVRLHRPATKAYDLTARWVSKLPALSKPSRLPLPRAVGVGRESGTVTLHAAGGVTVKVTDVSGGRRSANGKVGKPSANALAVNVATYYWPYRPFALTVQLSRQAVRPTARVDQLVRVDRREVQLLVQAALSAKRGRIFGASFALPAGYELLSAIGPAVEDHYEQTTGAGRRLHVNFRAGVTATKLALVLVRKGDRPEELAAPAVTLLDADGNVLEDQAGRLAVQVAASLDAETAGLENLRPIAPRAVRGWLDAAQARSVQFAYQYDKPAFGLRLKVRPQKTRVRVEVFGGLTVQPTSAWTAYRLRYRIEGTPIDRVRFTLPSEVASQVAVASPALRSVAKAPGEDGRTVWTVALVNEVTGTLDLTVNFARPIKADTTSLAVPRIVTDVPGASLDGYRAVLAVQNASRHELTLRKTARLVPLAQSAQAKLLAEPIRRNLQFVLQSFTDDWSAVLGVTPAKAAARIDAIVDLLALTTVIDPAGRCRYEAKLSLQNRTRQFLRVKVPGALRLWSATVAGQPVKPVVGDGAAGVVLIPLVKTSPGGLPYDVTMYLAGRAAEPVGWIGRIQPPAVRVEDIKVVRTTWSLRLPTGYRYIQPGGNLSPVVAGVERKIVALRARLDQLHRLRRSYDELVSTGSAKGKRLAQKNWSTYNRKITKEIEEARQTIVSNSAQISAKDNIRLQGQLDLLVGGQRLAGEDWELNERRLKRADDNVNVWLNNDAPNHGLSEVNRNAHLLAVPGFVRGAAKKQKEEITREIAGNLELINADKSSLQGKGGKTGGKVLDYGGQRMLLADRDGDESKRAEIAGVLTKLRVEQKRFQQKRQDELKSQLALLGDNRMDRYYGNLAKQQEQAQGQTGAQQGGQTIQLNGGPVRLLQPGGDRNQPAQLGLSTGRGRDRRKWGAQPGPGRAGRPSSGERGSDSMAIDGTVDVGGNAVRGERRTVTVAGGLVVNGKGGEVAEGLGEVGYLSAPLAVARGTFSLPVALPAGGVQCDFHGPSAEPVVSILAVDERLIEGTYSTGVVLVLATIAWLLSRLWVQLRRADAPPTGREFVAAYAALVVVLAGLVVAGGIGVLGAIVLFGAIACPVEAVHRILARRLAPAVPQVG